MMVLFCIWYQAGLESPYKLFYIAVFHYKKSIYTIYRHIYIHIPLWKISKFEVPSIHNVFLYICICIKYTFESIYILSLWKETFNSDGQQFHPHQQNEQSHLNLNWLNTKKDYTYDIGNPGYGLGEAHICGRAKSINWIPNPSR